MHACMQFANPPPLLIYIHARKVGREENRPPLLYVDWLKHCMYFVRFTLTDALLPLPFLLLSNS